MKRGEPTVGSAAALQAELAGVKAEGAAKVATLEGTIANLAHENALLRRRLYGNKTERSVTSELQLALGDLLAGEAQLQKDLAAAPTPPQSGQPPVASAQRACAVSSRGMRGWLRRSRPGRECRRV